MPNDAKLGLVVGVGLIITIAVVFFRKDGEVPPAGGQPAATVKPVPTAPPSSSTQPGTDSSTLAKTSSRSREGAQEGIREVRKHVVREGETLFRLAQHYYGDGEKFSLLFRANRDVLKTPDDIPPGTVLVVPDEE